MNKKTHMQLCTNIRNSKEERHRQKAEEKTLRIDFTSVQHSDSYEKKMGFRKNSGCHMNLVPFDPLS